MKTFVFEAAYNDGDGGGRCDVVQAHDRDTAIRLAALKIIKDNEWDDASSGAAYCECYSTLAGFYAGEMTILHEWTDLDGTACPNCTSHGGVPAAGFSHEDKVLTMMRCPECDFQWIPVGKAVKGDGPTAEEMSAELDAWERKHMRTEHDFEEDECGINVCVKCGVEGPLP